MQGQTYNIVYAGAIRSGMDAAKVKASFVEQLNIPQDKVDRLFNGKRIVLKKALNRMQAEKWQQRLLSMGAETMVVPNVDCAAPDANVNVETNDQANGKDKSPVADTSQKKATPENPEAELEAKIRLAKAMIATQQMEAQLNAKKESKGFKKLFITIGFLIVLLVVTYFYADSII